MLGGLFHAVCKAHKRQLEVSAIHSQFVVPIECNKINGVVFHHVAAASREGSFDKYRFN
jgi:hypothetical protein